MNLRTTWSCWVNTVFFDENISSPKRMGCVTCHDPATGGTGSVSGVNLHQVAITGANPHTVGNLKPPTNAYASFIDEFQPCNSGGLGVAGFPNYCGGNFWNGRSEGNLDMDNTEFPDGATAPIGFEVFSGAAEGLEYEYEQWLGPVADQAMNPFPNDVEHNVPDGEDNGLFGAEFVCRHVASAKYAELYEKAWNEPIDCDEGVNISFKRIAVALSAYQASADLNSFSSKRDKALRAELACACDGSISPPPEACTEFANITDPPSCDEAVRDEINYQNSPGVFPLVWLTEKENYGHDLFYATFLQSIDVNGESKFSNCAFCHSDNPVVAPFGGDTGDELFQLYSADDYHNIGTPRNPEIPETSDANGDSIDSDLGLAGHADSVVVKDDEGNDITIFCPPGFFKTPTLRNVDKRKGNGFIKAYTHNGWFKSLESIVHFYNTAATTFTIGLKLHNVTQCVDANGDPEDVKEKEALARNCWPEPAYGGGAIPFLVGNLGLTAEDEAAIVAYLKTLTDEHTATAPKPYKPEPEAEEVAATAKKGKKH